MPPESFPHIYRYIGALVAVTAGLVCAFAAFGPGRFSVADGRRRYLYALGCGGAMIALASLVVLFSRHAIVAATLCALGGMGLGALISMEGKDHAGHVSLAGGIVALMAAMGVYAGW